MDRLTVRESDGTVSRVITATAASAYQKLANYEDLEEQGRLVKLPEGFNEDKLFTILGTSGICPNYQGLKRVANCSSTPCWDCWEAALKNK